MSSCQQYGTFWGRPVNPKFNAYRRRLADKIHGPKYTYLAVKTDDATGNITEIPYAKKSTITDKLKDTHEKIDNDTFIGAKDFVVIFRECWR